MNKINDRFLAELFDQKKVRCHQEVYIKVFHIVWPCEGLFRKFLSCSATDLKIEYAKKIYGHLRAFEDVILPEFTVNNIISNQLNKLVNSSEKYVPQDHFIHSVNLYILGVYLFFNLPLFHQKIMAKDNIGKTLYEKVSRFIKKWKIFALFHDVGYYFESNIDVTGSVEEEKMSALHEYKRIYPHLIYEYVTRSTARTILCGALVQRSRRRLSSDLLAHCSSDQWKGMDKMPAKDAAVKELLRNYDNATILENVKSESIYTHFGMVLDRQKTLMIVLDKNECPVGFIERFGNKVEKLFIANNSSLDTPDAFYTFESMRILENLPPDCMLEYCINDADNVVYEHLLPEFRNYAKRFYDHLPNTIKTQLSFATSDTQINECYFAIYQWLTNKAGEYLLAGQILPEFNLYQKSMSKFYETAINDCVSDYIRSLLMDTKSIETSEIPALLRNIGNSMKGKVGVKELTRKIVSKANQKYNEAEGISHDMLAYYQQAYYRTLRDFLYFDHTTDIGIEDRIKDRLNMLQFIQFGDKNTITISIFAHGNACFENRVYDKIRNCASRLKINFDKLTSYCTDYTSSDHGLISAGLLYQATVFAHCLAHYSKKHDDNKLAWHWAPKDAALLGEEAINDYAEVIFSILLHNIYTQESKQTYGIEYRHDIDEDPFSYFCAFCDTFQKWDRPKQVDYSKAGLPSRHFLSDEFDIFVTEDSIYLKANAYDVDYIRNSLRDENHFLPGIVHFVHVMEYYSS